MPDCPEAWYGKGKVSYARKDYVAALEYADGALGLRQDACSWNLRGLALFQMGREADALHAFRQAVGLKPQLAGFHHNCGVARYHLGETSEAEMCFRRSLRLGKGQKASKEALSQLRATRGDLWHWWFSRPAQGGRLQYRLVGGALLFFVSVLVGAVLLNVFVPSVSQAADQSPQWRYVVAALATCLFLFSLPTIAPRLSFAGVPVDLKLFVPLRDLPPMPAAHTTALPPIASASAA